MNNIDKTKVGRRINEIRLNKGLTMEEFGENLNTSKGTVNNWEKGRNLPNNERLKKIADLANIEVNELLYGDKHEFICSLIAALLEEHYMIYIHPLPMIRSIYDYLPNELLPSGDKVYQLTADSLYELGKEYFEEYLNVNTDYVNYDKDEIYRYSRMTLEKLNTDLLLFRKNNEIPEEKVLNEAISASNNVEKIVNNAIDEINNLSKETK